MEHNQASAKSADILRTILRERGDVNALSLAFQNIDALATAPAIAARFHRSPSSIYRWKRAGRAIAFRPRGAKRDLFPLAQFTNRGVAAWAKDIIEAVGNGTAAFHFLMVGRESLRGETVIEYVGFKSGLGVNQATLAPHIPERFRKAWTGNPGDAIRIRSEDFQDLIAETLLNLGVPDPGEIPFFAPLTQISRHDPKFAAMFDDIKAVLPRFRKHTRRGDQWNLGELLTYAAGKYGATGSELAVQLALNPDAGKRGPWGVYRDIVWHDIRELGDLFTSENLQTFHGQYFDQRFIDYLAENHGDLEKIQWRQFEGLTAEHFARAGYKVEMGPGRDDDNIDVRAWTDDAVGPPTILIQCKRQRQKVGKVIVKALYADIVHERAKSGLIVTSSTLAPGTAKLLTARGYPIDEAGRDQVLNWVRSMRTQ